MNKIVYELLYCISQTNLPNTFFFKHEHGRHNQKKDNMGIGHITIMDWPSGK